MFSHFEYFGRVTPYGLSFLLAIVTAWWLARRNAVSINIDGSHVDLLSPITIVIGVAGGTLLSLLMPMDRMVAGELMQIDVRVRLFGFLGLAALAILVYSRIEQLSFRRLLDVFALPTLAGLMIHRVGCFLAGCCWGDLVSEEPVTRLASQIQTLPFLGGLSSGVQYPQGSLPFEQHLAIGLIEPDALTSLAVYPVQLYESALLLVALLALLRIPWRRLPQGMLVVVTACTYGVIRFFIEYLRADGHIVLGNMTVTQLQSLFIIGAAVLLLSRMLRDTTREGQT